MRRIIGTSIALVLVALVIAAVVSGCAQADAVPHSPLPTPHSPFSTYLDIPGVTAEEIAAIEAIIEKQDTLIYGMILSTEAFLLEEGEGGKDAVGGYAALFCEWLTGLFGIQFQPALYEWNDLFEKLDSGEIDFAGDLTRNEERLKTYYMTDSIAERQYKMMRLRGSPALEHIALARPLRYAFLQGAVTADTVAAVSVTGTYETILVSNFAEAYIALENGDIDAIIEEGVAEASFDVYGNVYAEDFLPLIINPVSMATANAELSSIISVITKAQRNGAMPYLNNLYNQGHQAYMKNKFFMLLDNEEKMYLRNTVSVPLAARYFNYPVDFYNKYEEKWEGIIFDVLAEVEELTGLKFEVANTTTTELSELFDMVYDGRAHIMPELIYSERRAQYVIWTKHIFLTDQLALLSTSTYPNVSINEIPNKRVGVIANTVRAEMFRTWFPNAENVTEYATDENAMYALEHDEIDLVMSSKNRLLSFLNFQEISLFKANFLFNYPYESTFGFNKDQTLLCSIMDKALPLIDTYMITEQWLTKTYDFRGRLLEAQRPWLIGAVILSLAVFALLSVLLYRSRMYRKRLAKEEAQVLVREADERAQIMLEQAPVVVMLWDENLQILDCNQEAIRVFGVSSKKEYMERFFELTPEFQPNGMASLELAKNAFSQAFETGYCHIEWQMNHAITGEPIPFDVTSSRVTYKGKYIAITYALDLRERTAAIAKMREADEKTKAMFDAMPLCSNFWTPDGTIVDCNDEVVKLFGLKDKQEYIDRFGELSPQYQPDGRPSAETAAALVGKAFKEGDCHFEWMMQKLNGEPMPTEVTLVRIEHRDDYMVVAYFRDLRDLKDSIAKMREADERSMIMLEQTPLVVMLWDKDANILDCNQEAVRVTGLSSKKEYVERIFEITPDLSDGTKSSEAAKKAIALCLETGFVRIPWALHHAVTGELIPFDVTIARVNYKGEDVAISYAQDVRERNAAIEKIREADDRARVMIEQAPLVVMLWDKDANILDCNQEALGILGLPSKQEYIERFFELAPDQFNGMPALEAAKMLLRKTLKTGYERIEWVLNHAVTGEAIPFDSVIARIKYKDEYILMSYGQDVRERNASIAKMREADERMHIIFDTTPLASCMFDKELNMFDCNHETVKMFGIPNKDFFLNRFFDLFPEYQPNGKLSAWEATRNIRMALEEGYNRFEIMHQKMDGEPLPAEVTLVRVKYRDEYAITSYMRDLTEQKAMVQLAKQQAEAEAANRAKSSFLASMSHEIRTPMNAILGITEIQLQNEGLSTDTKNALNMICNSGYTLLGIINDLLDLSKIEAGKLELINARYEMPSLINDTINLNTARLGSKPIEFKLQVDGDLPFELIGDELRVKQILNNLLSNAFKYTEKGEVSLSFLAQITGNGDISADSANADDENAPRVTLVITVRDTGQGMTEDQIQGMFDAYSRFNLKTNRYIEGTGLGMNIVQYLVKQMDGFICVESELGKGTEVTVHLKQGYAGAARLGKELAENLNGFHLAGMSKMKKAQIVRENMPYGSVLVVDDMETNLYVAKGFLLPYGLKIETVLSGKEAIEKIDRGNVYDIVFMDHMMPVMDGIEAVKVIRGKGYKHPIVALTANAVVGQADVFMANGFDGFISKPIGIRELNASLNKFVRDRQPPEVVEAARASSKSVSADTVPQLDKELVKIFIRDAEKASAVLQGYEERNSYKSEDLQMYIINAHALKSALANIGEMNLSNMALGLEQAGRERNIVFISDESSVFLNELGVLVDKLKSGIDEHSAVDVSDEDMAFLHKKLLAVKDACVTYDKNTAKAALTELKQKSWPDKYSKLLDAVAGHLLHSDFEEAEAVCAACLSGR
ncbi:MAG: transporter substrate-binding domain-containing protein [Treponema sp.]|jgi:PAS domain S-box-containing protein|nr:transporter substrate-binding domain-containing protein [Treponema sp.]